MSSCISDQEPDMQKEELLRRAEELKAKGNECFLGKNYDEAKELYTQAIELLANTSQFDVITGRKLLTLRDDYMAIERQRVFEIQQKRQIKSKDEDNDDDSDGTAKTEAESAKSKMRPYDPPKSEFANELAIYHSNRAACMMKLIEGTTGTKETVIIAAGISYEAIIDDCDISLLHKPGYVKALLRRMAAFEQEEKYEEALADAKEALDNETKPSTKSDIRRHIKRLEKLHHDKMEKLKEETLGKLKDLGNSFLSNFGISLDQFKAEKDPSTGSYSISFNNK